MLKNIGTLDRRVRLVAAAVFATLALFVVEGTLAWAFGIIAVLLAVTSAAGTCPAYIPFGFSTRREYQTA